LISVSNADKLCPLENLLCVIWFCDNEGWVC